MAHHARRPPPASTWGIILKQPLPNPARHTRRNYPGSHHSADGPGQQPGHHLEHRDHLQRTPTIYNYNFALEYELPHQVVVTAGYVGSRGLFLPFNNVDLNQLSLPTIARYGNALCIMNTTAAWRPTPGR